MFEYSNGPVFVRKETETGNSKNENKKQKWDRILKRKIIYEIRYFRLLFLKCWPFENERFSLFLIAILLNSQKM